MPPPNKKLRPKSSPLPNKIPPEFEAVYKRTTCQKCGIPVTEKRILNCKNRRFWPVCEECEKKIIPIYKEAVKKLGEIQKRFG